MKEGFVAVPGGNVWYQLYDTGAKGTPVIILHGGPGSSHYSLRGLKVLANERPVIFYDQLGCGKSNRPEDTSLWTIDRYVEELKSIREALSLEEVHILGHSWGTTLAAAYYINKKPAGVKSIIFSSPCLSAPLWAEDQVQNRKKLPEDIQETLIRCEENGMTDSKEYRDATAEFNKRFVCRIETPKEDREQGAKYKNAEIYNIMWGPSEFHVTGNLKTFDCTDRLHEIDIPTLFTCGRYDEATPRTTKYYSSLAPDSAFHVYEESAHLAYIEEQEEYVQVVSNFFKEHDEA